MAVAWSGFGEPPALDPIISHEQTDYGWRGLTANGEVLSVRGTNGHKVDVPANIMVTRNGEVIGQREVTNRYPIAIDDYRMCHNHAIKLFKQNKFDEALAGFDAAIAMAPTASARFNRGLVLLSMGRWREGFEPYEARLELMTPPMCRGLKLKRWRGEPIEGKSLLLVHDAGFGDTVMMLRYVPWLLNAGIDVRLLVPPELERLANQIAPVTKAAVGDYFCPMLSLLHQLEQTIETIPDGSYLPLDWALVTKWRGCVSKRKRKIGVAWSVGRTVEGDYPRAMPLADLLALVDNIDACEVHSIQVQEAEQATQLGVYPHEFEDLADCAALISLMDEIITVDTAAAHLAGAIGHPNATVLLSHWASWRWHDNPFYPNIKLRQQQSPGDWRSVG